MRRNSWSVMDCPSEVITLPSSLLEIVPSPSGLSYDDRQYSTYASHN